MSTSVPFSLTPRQTALREISARVAAESASHGASLNGSNGRHPTSK